ncbi:MAG: bifunctional diaminohydroxyphosphoribosylaminopyrimidine deaminase/5-amino-6-(5-phosphoribosylamino)uracil reductase RibD [Phycisphaerales bacterium]|nr:MAG: bifunctional diaminohydroxyphosphoribosylaminopyrimidine deaminase/5-amino-6-(5-phosphoribosylamino)uracil reductase RibD [Phycisphaerales bacterium]
MQEPGSTSLDPEEKHRIERNASPEVHRRLMLRAVGLSRRGAGRVEPNPMVGCVIARGDRLIGEGYHRKFGGPHAELEALANCTESAQGATAYVTLEPCRHHGKTPPCTKALIEAGIAEVFVAVRDPLKEVSGGGIRELRQAGIKVHVGSCAEEAAEVLAPFLVRVRLRRPYVIAKWAQSLDGRLATRTGHSQWISCEESRRQVHKLRARVDAILVGSGTVLADDPMLTARDVVLKRRALRVVLDGRLRLREKCQLVAPAGRHRTLVFTSPGKSKSPKARRLIAQGVEVVGCRRGSDGLSLSACLAELHQREVTNLLVEGGAAVLSSFLRGHLVDEARVFVAPIMIGGNGASVAFAKDGVERVDKALAPRKVSVKPSAQDVVYQMHFTDPLKL